MFVYDPTCLRILVKMLRSCLYEGDRTFEILTKIDLMDKGTDAVEHAKFELVEDENMASKCFLNDGLWMHCSFYAKDSSMGSSMWQFFAELLITPKYVDVTVCTISKKSSSLHVQRC